MERLTRSASDQLTLHLSKQTTDPELARLFRSFEAVAQHMGIAFSTTHEVVDIMKEHRVLPHERFALRRMMAGTLTSDPARWGSGVWLTYSCESLPDGLLLRLLVSAAPGAQHALRRRGAGEVHVRSDERGRGGRSDEA